MAILNNTHFVETQGIENQKQFGVELNSIAFKILSDKIYSDSISAIIRELACNAYDAHKAAGTEHIPFDLKCPTEFDPHFKIRDYGTGLSEEDVYKVYSNFFVSTKRDSNEFIGALGLGSKTPFAYTDAFTVNSFFNGTKTVYSAFLGAGGVPTIAKLVEMPTEEPNGLEIVVAVKPNDFNQFKEKTEQILVLFDPKPNSNVDIQSLKFGQLEPGVFGTIAGWQRNVYATPWYAVQGNIIYPIARHHIPNATALTKTEIYFFFENGDLSFTASRESLEYDQKTIDALSKKVEECYSIVGKKYDTVSSYVTIHDAFKAWEEINRVYGLHPHFNWKGIDFNSSGIELDNDSRCFSLASYMKSGYQVDRTYRVSLTRDISSMLLVGQDKTKANTIAIKSYLQENPDCQYVYLLDMNDYDRVKDLGFTCMLMSELNDLCKVKKKPAETKSYIKFGSKGVFPITEDEVYFIPTFRGKVRYNNTPENFLPKDVILKIFEDQLIDHKPIYFIPESDLSTKVLKTKKLINFMELIEEKKDVIANHYSFLDDMLSDQIKYSSKFNFEIIEGLMKKQLPVEIKEVFEELVKIKTTPKQDITMMAEIKHFLNRFSSYKFQSTPSDVNSKFNDIFPMLQYINRYNGQNQTLAVKNYMIDQIKKHWKDEEGDW